MSDNQEADYLRRITDFFDKIGLEYHYTTLPDDTFLPGVTVSKGRLLIDKDKLKYVGDLLHEAGHIAVQPAETRHQLNENVNEEGQGDAEEMAAIAWSWAALTKTGVPAQVIFHQDGYKGAADSIRTCFETGGLLGQPLLSYFGMCKPGGEPDGFPEMITWLRQELPD